MESRTVMKSPSDSPTIRRSDLLLGVDTGGTHTTVVVAREDLRLLARAEGPGAAMRPEGAERSAVVIAETVRRAAALAGVDLPAARLVVGAAGAGRAPERRGLQAAPLPPRVARPAPAANGGGVAPAAAVWEKGGGGGGGRAFLDT